MLQKMGVKIDKKNIPLVQDVNYWNTLKLI